MLCVVRRLCSQMLDCFSFVAPLACCGTVRVPKHERSLDSQSSRAELFKVVGQLDCLSSL